MSLRNRLNRAKQGKSLPDIYKNLPAQTIEIIKQIKISVSGANSYFDVMPPTRKEWDRLRQDNVFKNEADHKYIYSFDAFVQEFGTCYEKHTHLRKINKAHTTWNKHNTCWSKCK